jgi:hypothetical protein
MAIEDRGILPFQPREARVDLDAGFELAHSEAENVSGGGIFSDVIYPLLMHVEGVRSVAQQDEYLDKALFLGAAVDLDIDDYDDPEIETIVDLQAELYRAVVDKTIENLNRIAAIKARKLTKIRGANLDLIFPSS